MNGALVLFSLSLFVLTLLALEAARLWWDGRFGHRHRVLSRMAQWDDAPAPFPTTAPPLRNTQRHSSRFGPLIALLDQRRRRRTMQSIASQFPDTLDFISRALRAGHDLPRALALASTELQDPIAGELRLTAEEVQFGAGLAAALQHLGERVPLPDLRTFIVAAALQRETGGDVTRVFDQLARLIREREALRAQIKVLSTEGRLSAWILSILPVATALLVQSLHPGLLGILTQDPLGRWALMGSLILWAFGILVMKKITHLTP